MAIIGNWKRSIIQTDFIRSNKNWVLLLSKRKFLICDISTFDILLVHDLEKSSSSYLRQGFSSSRLRQVGEKITVFG